LHKGRRRKIFGIDQRNRGRFENDGANLWPDADQLKGFERLDGLAYAGPADGQFFSQLFFGRQALARLYLPFSNQVEDISDYLGSNRLSTNQAVPPEPLAV